MSKQKKIMNEELRKFCALVEVKKDYLQYMPNYLRKLIKNNHIVCGTSKILYTDRHSKTKTVKFNNFLPTNNKNFDSVKYRYWLKLLVCNEECQDDHQEVNLLDSALPEDVEQHFKEKLVRVYIKETSGMVKLVFFKLINIMLG